MGSNCYSASKPEETKGIDIIEKVQNFLKNNNFFYSPASKINNFGQKALEIQSDEDLENFLYHIIDQKEILRLQITTIKKVMQLMNFSVRIKSISDEDLPVIIIEMLFLILADPDRAEIQNEKFNIIKLLINTEKSEIDKVETKVNDKVETKVQINTRKFINNIRLFINIIYIIMFTYILLIVFLPNGQAGLDLYFENQDKQGLGMEDTVKWVYKIIESITNESVEKEAIIERSIRFVEDPIRNGK